MKKILLGVLIAVIGVVALGSIGVVNAQSNTPQATDPDFSYGMGMMYGHGNRGGMAGNAGGTGLQDGLLHDEMIAYFADQLSLSVDTLASRLSGGETLSQIVLAEGYTLDDFRDWMTEARTQAVSQAIANGTLTQQQADWISQRGTARSSGIRGAGTGSGQCPYYQPAN